MKTFSAPVQKHQKLQTIALNKLMPLSTATLRNFMVVPGAMLPAATIVTLSVWVAGLEVSTFLGVCTWGAGFIFLGLAVDGHGTLARFQLATGIALPVLALLQKNVSPDFIIVAGALLAAWLGAAVLKRLSP